jgi:uncharacterized protein YgiM (DUF1202 family)
MKPMETNKLQNKSVINTEKTNNIVENSKPNNEPKKDVNNLVSGIVTNCKFLNVRKSASTEAIALAIIDKGDKVTIDMNASNNDWYKIRTTSGIDGFSMKKFIEVN